MNGSKIDYILKRMGEDGIRNYAVYDRDKKTIIEEHKDDSLTVDQAIERMRSTLEYCDGLVFVELATMSKAERAKGGGQIKNALIPVQCGGAVAGIGSTNGGGNNFNIGALTNALEEKFEARITAMEEKNRMQQEISELKRQLAEAKEVNPTTQAIMGLLPNILPQVVSGIFGKVPAPIAGHPQVTEVEATQDEATPEQLEIVNDALTRLFVIDPELPQTLQKLAYMAENNKPMFDMARQMLYNQ